MAVFHIEKTKDYTVMANHHLKNKNLSLKAKGLLSVILSLPEDWNYTTRGLACICKEYIVSYSPALVVVSCYATKSIQCKDFTRFMCSTVFSRIG